MKKTKVGIIYGGNSDEHDVSIKSAQSVFKFVDTKKYSPALIYVKRNGNFNLSLIQKQDVIFPLIHGKNGEDGTLQGILRFLGIPFVGAGVLGSAVSMDKDVSKRLLEQAKLSVTKFITLRKDDDFNPRKIITNIGLPLFVKPANQGSSYGISKVKNSRDLVKAINFAFKFDSKILIEKFVAGREIECAVIGNSDLLVSSPGEVFPKGEFHDFNSKYQDSMAAIPAKLSKAQILEVQNLTKKVYRTLECRGMARVDFFLTSNGKFIVNELNTIPGFTNESMFPKLWEKSGLTYSKLIDKLITLALKK